jgi:hypothetical protein
MRKNTVNYLVDLVGLLAMLGMVFTGAVMRFILPPGSGGRGHGQGLTLWGLGRHDWGDIHYILAWVLAATVLVHVVLHWNWVVETTRQIVRPSASDSRRPGPWKRGLYGAGFLAIIVALMAVLLWYAASQRVATNGDEDEIRGGFRFRGGRSMRQSDLPPSLESRSRAAVWMRSCCDV